MDLVYSTEQQAFRGEVRQWLEEHVPTTALESFDTAAGFEQHRQWEKTLAQGNWGMVTWPKAYGGLGCNLIEWLIFEEEYYRVNAPLRVNQNGIFLLGPTLMEYGTEAQKQRFITKMASGEEIWAQGWSEPGAGSDMAAIQSKAIRDGDEYVINGQKIWSTRAVFADWIFCIFRTDPDASRHAGLSFIFVPLNAPGVTVRPIRQLNGLPGFAEIFFDNVRVPVFNRLGEEGEGWKIAMSTAGFERGLMLRSPARFQEAAKRLVALYRKKRNDILDLSVEDAVVRCYMDAQAYALSTYQTASRLMSGGNIGAESSCNKIFWSELDMQIHATAMNLLGSKAELEPGCDDAAAELGAWLDGFLFSLSGPIYAGTNEIQRNIIAERMLGMPKK
ncbi:MAG: acyl-CoA dehydrogenase family protein [SAR86 cluster bacterium]|jgi:alkylation response protein AidB-like acyl-CoA dehydrogenase|uniref:Acyl-CoA dehydrogenase family protein n=1 Tax=SAR86 cluster bacterium TaxID=2030880 RepID=A0A973A9M2_9GAMM|nr:acyl-CoA dehydrogenase family protein [SAR86 cluster bacterium]|tara:strand:- start:2926 stop:4092 length:1167 start_codon:yes stop_codon:yes gene_type:complete